MSEMVERVAAALYEQWAAFFDISKTWDGAKPHSKDEFRNIARAAIEGMREPTEGMLRPITAIMGKFYADQPVMKDDIRRVWRDAIDAALK